MFDGAPRQYKRTTIKISPDVSVTRLIYSNEIKYIVKIGFYSSGSQLLQHIPLMIERRSYNTNKQYCSRGQLTQFLAKELEHADTQTIDNITRQYPEIKSDYLSSRDTPGISRIVTDTSRLRQA